MDLNSKLARLSGLALEFRRRNGFEKNLPAQLQDEARGLRSSGEATLTELSKALGVSRSTIAIWCKSSSQKRSRPSAGFRELEVSELSQPEAEPRFNSSRAQSFHYSVSLNFLECDVVISGASLRSVEEVLALFGGKSDVD